jgi:hypothetical protein
MKTKKIEIGDVFEILTPKGMRIYLQCVEIPEDVKNNLELIKVFYTLHKTTPEKINSIVEDSYFFNRFPLKAAYRKKIVEKIGNVPLLKNFEIPKYYRTTNFTDDAWQIVDANTLKRVTVSELTDEQKKLSPWGSMNDTLIIELLERGWTLENWELNNMFIE